MMGDQAVEELSEKHPTLPDQYLGFQAGRFFKGETGHFYRVAL
jgi:hypothetical protein